MTYNFYNSLKKTPTCPICGKHFVPAIEHMWKIGGWGDISEERRRNVCSYTCMRKWEKEQEANDKKKKKRYYPTYISK